MSEEYAFEDSEFHLLRPAFPATGRTEETYGFDFLTTMISGAGILSFEPLGADEYRIQLSGERLLTISNVDGETRFDLVLQSGLDWEAPIPLYLRNAQGCELLGVSEFLRNLAMVHSLLMLLRRGQADSLRVLLREGRDQDVPSLLNAEDRIELVSFSAGSWFAELKAIGEEAIDNIVMLVLIVTPEGRRRIQERQKTKAIVNEAKARKAEAEAKKLEAEANALEAKAAKVRTEANSTHVDTVNKFLDIYRKQILPLDKDDPVRIAFMKHVSAIPELLVIVHNAEGSRSA